jgi:hypothetical protein
MTSQEFVEAVQAAINAPAKSGTKWEKLEKLFSDNGLRGNGALNNSAGADRTTRVRQLGTSKKHSGHDTRATAAHSVFVIGGDTVGDYIRNPSHYIDQVERSLTDEHPTFETCLIMVTQPAGSVSPVCLIKRSVLPPKIPYEVWWPNLEARVLPERVSDARSAIYERSQFDGMPGVNEIYFGPPGTGKSTEVKKRVASAQMLRAQFHPEYTHSDLVGSYRPVVGSEINSANQISGHDGVSISRPVNYFSFVPGPLSLAMQMAFTSEDHVFLVIEEINRGDCAAIFGDMFQLLDRDDSGQSEFGITPKPELLAYFRSKSVDFEVAGDGKLYLPSNLSLLATMNTSDQSLYPMDSAFKRRWNWVACPIDFTQLLTYTDGIRPFLDDGKSKWDWINLVESINKSIVRDRMEDKQLGPWFIKLSKSGLVPWDEFLNKCLFYLWHDVFKDEQLSDASPFRLDGPAVFSEVQKKIRDSGLAAGFKQEFLFHLEAPSLTKAGDPGEKPSSEEQA